MAVGDKYQPEIENDADSFSPRIGLNGRTFKSDIIINYSGRGLLSEVTAHVFGTDDLWS